MPILKIMFHNSRHTFGTLLAKETGDIYRVMGLMGITKPETAIIYTRLAKEIELAMSGEISKFSSFLK